MAISYHKKRHRLDAITAKQEQNKASEEATDRFLLLSHIDDVTADSEGPITTALREALKNASPIDMKLVRL